MKIAHSIAALALAGLMGTLTPLVSAQDAEKDSLDRDYEKDMPRIPATEPADVQATFKIDPAYRIDLIAAEPLVHDPIAMAFDEQARMFVVEMRGYSERRDMDIGAVRMLTAMGRAETTKMATIKAIRAGAKRKSMRFQSTMRKAMP